MTFQPHRMVPIGARTLVLVRFRAREGCGDAKAVSIARLGTFFTRVGCFRDSSNPTRLNHGAIPQP